MWAALGRWIDVEHHDWFFDPNSERLYGREQEDNFLMFPRAGGRASSRYSVGRFNALAGQAERGLPVDAYSATVERHRSVVFLTGYDEVIVKGEGSRQTLEEFVANNLHEDARWAVNNFQALDGGEAVAAAIASGTCIAVSDGSFKDEFLTLIEGTSKELTISSSCVVPG